MAGDLRRNDARAQPQLHGKDIAISEALFPGDGELSSYGGELTDLPDELPPKMAEMLHRNIMEEVEAILARQGEEVEAILARQADSLWKRGQAELGRLQLEKSQVITSLSELQARQEQMVAEQTAMRGALAALTSKLEFVATEMREAVRSLPSRASTPGSPEVAGACQSDGDGARALAKGSVVPPWTDDHKVDALEDPALLFSSLSGSQTPPRLPRAGQDLTAAPGSQSRHMAPQLPGSPAVLLSLASVLGWTSLDAAKKLPGSTVEEVGNRGLPRPGCDVADPIWLLCAAAAEEETLAAAGQSSTPVAGIGSPVSTDVGIAGAQAQDSGASRAGTKAMQLRAEAPAFVPGCGGSSAGSVQQSFS
eukprot:CAMPEP_0170653546 /NCGR_PEP_ID=MMETSP0224-20130122/47462_1 /TAXON_ID=285029 /ORGANISM="Togula jolla, Strain CCCM 725" /LENGTH=364 /DNA_ID=CAMNT_0010985419 /DNA_START=27 /DNA_END=1122 /DNA_ORIENTATION=+